MKKTIYSAVGVLILLVSVDAHARKWETRSAQAYGGAKLDDDYKDGALNLTATSTQYELPGKAGLSYYMVCARGNTAYVSCGDNPTVGTAEKTFTFSVPDGSCMPPLPLTGPKCAYIATSTAGHIVFLHFNVLLD